LPDDVSQLASTELERLMMYDLAAWFDIPKDASGPRDDSVREEVLMDISAATACAEDDGHYLFQCPKGRALIFAVQGTPIIDGKAAVMVVDYVANDTRIRFWMNTSSIQFILDRCHNLPKVDFVQLLAQRQP
jgi:hypothetical protein